eukprot:gene1408-1777_t
MFSAGMLLSSLTFGSFTARLGRFFPFIISLVLLGASTVLFAYADHLYIMFIARFLQGCSSGVTWIFGMAIIGDVFHNNQLGRVMSSVSVCATIGSIIGPNVGGVVFERLGYRAGLAILNTLVRILLVSNHAVNLHILEKKLKLDKEKVQEISETTPLIYQDKNPNYNIIDNQTTPPPYQQSYESFKKISTPMGKKKLSFKKLLTNPEFLVLLFTSFVNMTGSTSIDPLIAIIVDGKFHESSIITSLVFTAISVPFLTIGPLTGWITDKYIHGKWTTLLGMIITMVAIPFIGFIRDLYQLFILAFVFGCGITIVNTPMLALIKRAADPDHMYEDSGRIFSVFNMSFSIAILVGPMFMGSVSLALFTDMVCYSIALPIIPLVIESRYHQTQDITGFIFAMFSAGVLLSSFVFGSITDRVGRYYPFILSLVILGISTVIFAYANHLALLFVARFCQGLSSGVTWVFGLATLADIYPDNQLGRVMGTVSAGNTLGSIIGPNIGGIIFQHLGYEPPFLIATGFAVLNIIYRVFLVSNEAIKLHTLEKESKIEKEIDKEINETTPLLNPDRDKNEHQHDGKSSSSSQPINTSSYQSSTSTENISTGIPTKPPTTIIKNESFLKTILKPEFVILILTNMVIFTGSTSLEPLLAIIVLDKFQKTSTVTSLLFTVFSIPFLTIGPLTGYITDKYIHAKWAILFGQLITVLAIPWISFVTELYQLFIIIFLFGCSISICSTPIMAMIKKTVDPDKSSGNNGKIYSTYNIGFGIAILIGPIFGTLLTNTFSLTIYSYCLSSLFLLNIIVIKVMLLSSKDSNNNNNNTYSNNKDQSTYVNSSSTYSTATTKNNNNMVHHRTNKNFNQQQQQQNYDDDREYESNSYFYDYSNSSISSSSSSSSSSMSPHTMFIKKNNTGNGIVFSASSPITSIKNTSSTLTRLRTSTNSTTNIPYQYSNTS